MADPVIVPCPEGEWTKVATNVVTGQVHKMESVSGKYMQTYRDTGGSAPTVLSEGVSAFIESISEEISAVAAIDVYIWCIGGAGSVRVDL